MNELTGNFELFISLFWMSLRWSSSYYHRKEFFMPELGNQPAVESQLVQLSSGVRKEKPEVKFKSWVVNLHDSNQLQLSTLPILEP